MNFDQRFRASFTQQLGAAREVAGEVVHKVTPGGEGQRIVLVAAFSQRAKLAEVKFSASVRMDKARFEGSFNTCRRFICTGPETLVTRPQALIADAGIVGRSRPDWRGVVR